MAPVFTEEDFRHWFTPQDGIVDSFVVDNGRELTGKNLCYYCSCARSFENKIFLVLPSFVCPLDFVSFYTLPSTVMHHPIHKTLKAAYSFYNVSNKTGWIDLMNDALIAARDVSDTCVCVLFMILLYWLIHLVKFDCLNFSFVKMQMGFDVFNALDLMENKEFLEQLKFGIGDGNLQYYLYNWRCPPMPPNKASLCHVLFLVG